MLRKELRYSQVKELVDTWKLLLETLNYIEKQEEPKTDREQYIKSLYICRASQVKAPSNEVQTAYDMITAYLETLTQSQVHAFEVVMYAGREIKYRSLPRYELDEAPNLDNLRAWRRFLEIDSESKETTIEIISGKRSDVLLDYISSFQNAIDEQKQLKRHADKERKLTPATAK